MPKSSFLNKNSSSVTSVGGCWPDENHFYANIGTLIVVTSVGVLKLLLTVQIRFK